MTASARAFLSELIDYAGLFPPAGLPLAPALDNYARYRGEAEAEMLGRFICPASRLVELEPLAESAFGTGSPFRFSVLARPAEREESARESLAEDLSAIRHFLERYGARVSADVLELRLPVRVARLDSLLDDLIGLLETRSPTQLAVFVEGSHGTDWEASIGALAEALAARQPKAGSGALTTLGLKLRCGGVVPELYPPVELVAEALLACRKHDLPFKATAGLHHPVRHYRDDLGVREHGFLNVFGAGILLRTSEMARRELIQLLADEDPASFAFDAEGFRWRRHRASTEQIRAARREAVLSFGSCSFDEPRDDLRTLGHLPR